jgi:hypothetical protein
LISLICWDSFVIFCWIWQFKMFFFVVVSKFRKIPEFWILFLKFQTNLVFFRLIKVNYSGIYFKSFFLPCKFENSYNFVCQKRTTVDCRYKTPLGTGLNVSYIGSKFKRLSYNWGLKTPCLKLWDALYWGVLYRESTV